mmetsp:Transcript_21246/g.43485  ORF Transcript_21246/g.43485 Transcript_21246/m.43485 type:complete len:240 (-) Transcript_21246:41-760(-)
MAITRGCLSPTPLNTSPPPPPLSSLSNVSKKSPSPTQRSTCPNACFAPNPPLLSFSLNRPAMPSSVNQSAKPSAPRGPRPDTRKRISRSNESASKGRSDHIAPDCPASSGVRRAPLLVKAAEPERCQSFQSGAAGSAGHCSWAHENLITRPSPGLKSNSSTLFPYLSLSTGNEVDDAIVGTSRGGLSSVFIIAFLRSSCLALCSLRARYGIPDVADDATSRKYKRTLNSQHFVILLIII